MSTICRAPTAAQLLLKLELRSKVGSESAGLPLSVSVGRAVGPWRTKKGEGSQGASPELIDPLTKTLPL